MKNPALFWTPESRWEWPRSSLLAEGLIRHCSCTDLPDIRSLGVPLVQVSVWQWLGPHCVEWEGVVIFDSGRGMVAAILRDGLEMVLALCEDRCRSAELECQQVSVLVSV